MATPERSPLDLYDVPRLYDTLKRPDEEDVAVVSRIVRTRVGPPPYAVLDPACGPGNWLVPFAAPETRLVGNDMHQGMVEFARARLGRAARVTQGDMYELTFEPGQFDVALEASGVTSLVPTPERLGRLLASLGRLLTPRGVILLLVHFDDPREDGPLPLDLFRTGWRPLEGGGEAHLAYTLVGHQRDSATRDQTIRRRVEVRGAPDLPGTLEQVYPMRIWSPDEVREAVRLSGRLEVRGCYDTDDLEAAAGEGTAPWVGARYLVFGGARR